MDGHGSSTWMKALSLIIERGTGQAAQAVDWLQFRARKWVLHLFLGFIAVSSARADDWPQYRGKDRSGVSRETKLLQSWPKAGPRLLWTCREAGIGFSPPAIVGDHLYSMGDIDRTDFAYALDTRTGKKIWGTPLGPHRLADWGGLSCLDRAKGTILWSLDLKKELQGKVLHDGRFTESVLIDGDRLICTPGGRLGAFAALDKRTGKVVWRSKDLTAEATSSSVIAVEVDGLRQYVGLTSGGVAGVAAEDGRLLWQSDLPAAHIMVATPLFFERCVYVTSAYGVGCGLIRLNRVENNIKTKVIYRNKVIKNHHSGVILVDRHIYGYSDPVGWTCQEFATGKEVWQQRGLFQKGSITWADGRFYCFGEETGTVALMKRTTNVWQEVSRFTIPETSKVRRKKGKIWTPPVIAHAKLYLRDQDLLFCYDIRANER